MSHSLIPGLGPLVVVPCCEQSDTKASFLSCDGWFLWQPEHMLSAVKVVKMLQTYRLEEETDKMEEEEKEEVEEVENKGTLAVLARCVLVLIVCCCQVTKLMIY